MLHTESLGEKTESTFASVLPSVLGEGEIYMYISLLTLMGALCVNINIQKNRTLFAS